MQRGATWLGSKLQAAAGRSVTYRRGPLVSESITGSVAFHLYEEQGGDGIVTSIESEDWTFTAAELIVGGEVIEPRDGDIVTETLNGFENTYEVMPVAREKCFRWADTSGILLLVHTKRVDRCPS